MGMNRAAALPLVILLGSSTAAWAQPGAPVPLRPLPPPPAVKSPGTGVGLAVAGSIVPAIVFGIGLSIDDNDTAGQVVAGSLVAGLILPSLGMIYAKQKKSPGMYPRAAAVLALGLGALLDGLGNDDDAGTWYAITGGLYVVGCGIDIALTPGAVRAYNARHARPTTLAVAPIAVAGGGGLALAGSF